MARQLTAAGRVVTFLGVFDTYADQSDHHQPWLRKYGRRGVLAVKKAFYDLSLLRKNPRGLLRLKLQSLRRATVDKLRYSKAQQYELIHGHSHQLGASQAVAQRNFQLQPQAIVVHLFRCQEQLYYLPDAKHLGWQEFALAGVKVHDLPGNHFYLFAPPNDQECARILQQALDENGPINALT